jgi:hypothetical protein
MKEKENHDDFSSNKKIDKAAFERYVSNGDEPEMLINSITEKVFESQADELNPEPDSKIDNALQKQLSLYRRKNEILSRLFEEEQSLKKKRKILKQALKKAEEKNLSKMVISLIKEDLVFVDRAWKKCKELIINEKAGIEKTGAVITTLKSLL